ncbi:MAG: LamG-like jellyroll fold domain-containing protein [Puniceicoccales bacterium]
MIGPGSFWSSDTPSGEGYSYRIDSRQSSYLSIPTEAQLNNLKDFTISWWMKLSSVDGNTDRIFSTRASHEAGEGYLDLIARSDTPGHLDLEFVFSNGHHNGRTAVRIDNLKADEWLFLALVRDAATGELKVYSCPAVRTAVMKVSDHPANRATNINNSPSTDMLIGGYPGDSKNRTPDGLFYDWRFYREALAPAAITTVFTQGLNGQE